MARNLQLALQLLARDTGSKVLKQALQGISRDTKAAQKTDDELAKSRQQNSTTAIRASRSLIEEYRRASSARATLGIRSEREIQREIQQTMAAYNRLTRTGMLSANEQSRAFRAMTDRVKTLRTELGGVNDSMTRMQRFRAAGSTVAAVAGGLTAAGMIIKDPVQRQMAYERRNAEIANTAYNNLSAPDRIKKIPEINNAIRGAVRYGGGTPEAAQETINSLFAGGLDDKTALKILPDITRYATASGANPNDLARIAIGAIKNFDIKAEDLPAVFDKTIRSGENGKYELADMAGSLPLTMTKANSVGMSGLKDLDVILAMLQANAETAGDNSAASTNVNNLLDKYTSADTQNALKNYRFKGKNGEALKYTDYLAQQRLDGVNTSDAFTNAVSGIVSADSRVQKLRAQAAKFKGTDKEKDILASLDIVVSSITSKIIADQQASTALKTSIMKKDFIKEQISGTRDSVGAGAASYDVMSSTNDFKSQQFESEKMFSEQDAMKPVADLYGDLTSKLTDYAKEYPELTTAISGATTGIKAMTAAAVAFAGLNFLTGGGINLPGRNPGGGIPPVGGGSRLGGIFKNLLRYGGRIGGPLAAAYAAYDLNSTYDEARDSADKSGMGTGEYLFKKIKEREANKKPLFDVDVGKAVSSWWSSPSAIGQQNYQTAGGYSIPSFMLPPQQQKSQPINLTTKLILDGREIASAVNEYNGEQSVRGSTGGPQ
ncbi:MULTISPECIES: phage tail tape measure protein [Enterobacteriaceae]|uniref:phage tail tape measure protein n=1 Tax=Enterobacteriaceae TaxID=543 RepID=UPI000460BE67|nr:MULTISPECIES: phage tail tape measure protein [Enterobacteriaceae]EMC4338545.1 phage tail tape measure protein [Cronobacter sakazakii]KDF62869.1 phage tail tape measure protein, TP901 family, core region [Enterobacter roggenkampii MGH 54]MBT1812381.1 phage tail tape measure protein [Enterobacter roggenkampii]TXU37521.1 phage tail tape measure protein [Enterobacter roggenkampii]TXU82915.1 phage tail tape measure protein [Enterobacter roggenkampii]